MSTRIAYVHLDDPYTHNAIVQALKNSSIDWDIIEKSEEGLLGSLQWLEYELINWEHVAAHSQSVLCNAYCIRKGMIRKAQLAYNVAKYVSKRPNSILKNAIPETWLFELEHPDYFEEAMNDVFEVEHDLQANDQAKEGDRKHIFIIKPSMANKAADIHVFDSLEALQAIFEEPDEEEEEDEETDQRDLSQLREWVIQRYIDRPLLVYGRKFHVRAYVLAVSNIQVYLYRDMLALLALRPYDTNQLSDNLSHLTNTCLQSNESDYNEEASVKLFWELDQAGISRTVLEDSFEQMQHILADLFDACTSEMTTFQAIPNAFELFGVDFLLDQDGQVYFLEANAFPDFKQTGSKLQHIIQELFVATTKVAIEPFFECRDNRHDNRFVKVFDRKLFSPGQE